MNDSGRQSPVEPLTAGQPNVLYEDNHLIVTVKPAGVLSQADGSANADMLSLLKAYIGRKYAKPGAVYLGLVHRLDQPVSGLMVFARTSKAASRLSRSIREHQMGKGYLACVEGCPEPAQGGLTDHLAQGRDGLVHVVGESEGKRAQLSYQVLQTVTSEGKTRALVAILLETGRQHQIRVQFASRGWPLLNDRRYGAHDSITTGEPIALQAVWLALNHPVGGRPLCFFQRPEAEPPWSSFDLKNLDSSVFASLAQQLYR